MRCSSIVRSLLTSRTIQDHPTVTGTDKLLVINVDATDGKNTEERYSRVSSEQEVGMISPSDVLKPFIIFFQGLERNCYSVVRQVVRKL